MLNDYDDYYNHKSAPQVIYTETPQTRKDRNKYGNLYKRSAQIYMDNIDNTNCVSFEHYYTLCVVQLCLIGLCSLMFVIPVPQRTGQSRLVCVIAQNPHELSTPARPQLNEPPYCRRGFICIFTHLQTTKKTKPTTKNTVFIFIHRRRLRVALRHAGP